MELTQDEAASASFGIRPSSANGGSSIALSPTACSGAAFRPTKAIERDRTALNCYVRNLNGSNSAARAYVGRRDKHFRETSACGESKLLHPYRSNKRASVP
jgi:hypothetical protein